MTTDCSGTTYPLEPRLATGYRRFRRRPHRLRCRSARPPRPREAPGRHRRPGPATPRPPRPEVHHSLRRGHPHPAGLSNPRRLSRLQRRPTTARRSALPDPGRRLSRRRPAPGQRLHLDPLPVRLHPPAGRTCPSRNARSCSKSTPPRPQRLKILNDYLVDLFIRTRRHAARRESSSTSTPATIRPTASKCCRAITATIEQHQYFPLFVFDGDSGFPLAAWLRPGTVHASCGAVDDAASHRRARCGRPGPTCASWCVATTAWRCRRCTTSAKPKGCSMPSATPATPCSRRAPTPALADLELYYHFYGHREPHVQRFEAIEDYQAESWSRPRRIVAKIEINRHGSNRRFVVTNLSGQPREGSTGTSTCSGATCRSSRSGS